MSRIQLSTPFLAAPLTEGSGQPQTGTPDQGPPKAAPGTPQKVANAGSVSYEDPDVRFQHSVKRDFLAKFSSVARDPKAFGELFGKVYGKYDRGAAERIRQQTLRGDTSWLPEVRFVQRETLQGGNGAYSAKNNTIYLSRDLQSNPSLLRKTFSEETGHHIDSKIKGTDTPGDEGELFRRLLDGETLSGSQVAAIRAENDKGVVQIDGQRTEVEFFLKKARKKFKKLTKRITRGVSHVAKKAFQGVSNVARGVANGVKRVAQVVTSPVRAGIALAKKAVSGVGSFVRNTVGKVGGLFKNALSRVGKLFKGTVRGVGGLFRNAFGKITDVIRSSVRGVSGLLGNVMSRVGHLFKSGLGFARDLFRGGLGFARNVLGNGLRFATHLFRTAGSPLLGAARGIARFGLGTSGRVFGSAGRILGDALPRLLSIPQTLLGGLSRIAGFRL